MLRFILIAVLVLPAPEAAAQPKKEDAFLAGNAFTFADLQKAVGVVFEGRLKAAVEKRGVTGPLTDAQLEQLKTAGATPALLEAIRAFTKTAPAATPATKPAGRLTLQCAPGDCDVAINGSPAGRTKDGLLELRGLPPGEVVVDLRRPGYQTEQITAVVEAGASRVKSVRLQPDVETLKKNGRDLLLKMMTRLGKAEPVPLTLTGTAILWTEGQRSDWHLNGNVNLEQQAAQLEIQGAGVKWKSSLKGGTTKSDGSGKLKGSAVAIEMDKLLRLFYAYQPSVLVKRLSAAGVTAIAPDERPEDHGVRLMKVQAGGDSFQITLAADGTPQRIETGGMELLLANFETLGGGLYPRNFGARPVAGDKKPPHELRFEKIAAADRK